MCLIISKIFRRLFGNCRQGGGRSKRPETFLTPYEMDIIPLMLKELDLANNRFYQMVCYRWFQEGQLVQKRLLPKSENDEENLPSNSNKYGNHFTFEDFLSEGQALKQLIQQVSRCLMEKGTLNEECENLIIRYRMERQEWQTCCQNSACSNNDPNNNNNQINDSIRSYSLSTVPSNGARYLNCPTMVITTASSPNWCSSSTCSYSTTTTTLSNNYGRNDTRSLLTTPQPNGDLNSDIEIDVEEKNSKIIQRHSRFDTKKNATTTITTAKQQKDGKKFKEKCSRKRTATTKERKHAANFVDALFVQLGEILIHQFRSTITVDNCKVESNILLPAIAGNKKSGSNENENVHERELKVLIWRHFIQMLVTMLTDKARFLI